MRKETMRVGLAVLGLLGSAAGVGAQTPDGRDADRAAIKAHIEEICQAFVDGDVARIRATHTDDWRGFPLRARALVRGIDAYMRQADEILEKFNGLRYEFLDTDVQVFGDVAVVYYLAREWLRQPDGSEKTILLRSVDIYRREPAGWNQCGSNICLVE